MSQLSRNIVANYASQIYVTIIGIVLLPLYIKYMGAEAYGLVGFFAMLQAWFAVLDLGLTPTIARETARYHGGALSALHFRQLYRVLTILFVVVAIIGGGVLFLASSIIADQWLKANALPISDVVVAIQIMSVSVALRWMCGLSRGVVTGSEKLVWLSWFNAIIASLRFVGVFIAMYYFGFTAFVFFVYQFFVAVIEFMGLAVKAHRLLPGNELLGSRIGWSFKPVRSVLKFSLTIAFTASVWVFVTQTDKLVLSGILPLREYGYFTLSVMVAHGIMVIGGPISVAIMPRMARLHAEKNYSEVIQVYRQSTQLVAVIAGSAAITLVITAKPLLIAWTGDLNLAQQAAPVLKLYAAGNLFLSISAFAYYLQYAKGNLRYHLIGNIGLVLVLIPCIIYAAIHFGAEGAGYVWLIMNILFLFGWVSYVHHKLEPGLYVHWLLMDAVKIIAPSFLLVYLLSFLQVSLVGRVENLVYVCVFGIVSFGTAVCFSEQAWSMLRRCLKVRGT